MILRLIHDVKCLKNISFINKILTRNLVTIYNKPHDAVFDVNSGSTILVGGFGVCGTPISLLEALNRNEARDFTLVSNNPGTGNIGIGMLVRSKKVKKMIASYIGENKEFEKQFLTGEIELDLTPQGTLAEKIRAGGAGIPAFYTATGSHSWREYGKIPAVYNPDGTVAKTTKPLETKIFNGRKYLLEESIFADFALIRAWKADRFGNLIFRKTAQNFNSPMATAARVTIAEVDEFLEYDTINPEDVHVPGLYVHRIVIGQKYEKPIEKIRYFNKESFSEVNVNKIEARHIITQRVACELKDGMYVNLGIGMPSLVSNYITDDMKIFLHGENGIIGMGPYPNEGEEDADLINPGKETVTSRTGASYFGSEKSFAMIRGGHIDMSVLGAMEVSKYGDIANWMIPGKVLKGMGGAMDLVNAPRTKIIVAMEHCSKDGKSKIVNECSAPLTGAKCLDMIVTEKAVFNVSHEHGLTLIEKRSDLTVEDIKNCTACDFSISKDLSNMKNILQGEI